MKLLVLVALALILAVGSIYRSRRKGEAEILPAAEMQRKYGLYAEKRRVHELDPSFVPKHLWDLIPLAQAWGEGDDMIRSDLETKAGPESKTVFRSKMTGRTAEVTTWLASFKGAKMSEEAAHFMYMLEALDEIGLWPDK